MKDLFRQDNTDGYTDEQLAVLNGEWQEKWEKICAEYGLDSSDSDSDDYDLYSKMFCDEVAKR